jgi:hypothetical protein
VTVRPGLAPVVAAGHRGRSKGDGDELQRTEGGVMDHDLGAMIDGFRALVWLDEHSDTVGLGGSCRPCSLYVAALLRGGDPAEQLHLRCKVAQMQQRQVDAAIAVIKRVCP